MLGLTAAPDSVMAVPKVMPLRWSSGPVSFSFPA